MNDTDLIAASEGGNAEGGLSGAEIVSYKGFARDWTCRGFQFEAGKTYEHDGEVAAFHACEHPLDVFLYYPPAESVFAEVRQSGSLSRNADDTKVASGKITITAELHLHEMIQRAVKYVSDRATNTKEATVSGEREAASATGYSGAASATGNSGAASATGDRGAASATGNSCAASATGNRGAASATGYSGAASATGNSGAASATGDRGAASATGYSGAASATGDSGAASATGTSGAASATGNRGAASATGDSGAASATGYIGAASATGKCSTAMACGYGGRAAASEGSAIFLVERNGDWEITAVFAGIAGRDGIKPDTFYTLRNGQPKEVA
jgi:hypothetical protein